MSWLLTFLAPAGLLWLGLLAPLVLLYVLKRRRRERLVGSTLLWEQALRDLRAERPFRRLLPQLSLLLQALAVVALAVALARPVGGAVKTGAGDLAVVIDVTPSMAARDPGQSTSRLGRAMVAARALVAARPPGARVTLLTAGADASVRVPLTAERAPLEAALDALAIEGLPRGIPGGRGLEAATALAAERLAGRAGGRIVVLTDAAADGEVALAAADVPLTIERLASAEVENAALVDAAAHPAPAEPGRPGDPDATELFARVRYVGAAPRDVFLEARALGQDRPLASRRLTLQPGEATRVVLRASLAPDDQGRAPLVELALRDAQGAPLRDALDLDDRLVIPSPAARRLSVFLVGPVPTSLERAILADGHVEVFRTDLARLAELPEEARPTLEGFVVYAGAVPDEPPPGLSLVLAPDPPMAFELRVGARAEAPAILTWAEDAEALRFVSFEDVHLAAVTPLAGAGRPLLETRAGPALTFVERGGGASLVLGFDLERSDWPRQPSFVIFVRNLLERARRLEAAGGIPPGPLGAPLRVPAPDGSTVRVTSPSGRTATAVARSGVALVPVPPEPGVFRVRLEDERERFALRALRDPAESDPRPRLRLVQVSGAPAEAGEAAAGSPGQGDGPWLALAAFGLLALALEAAWATRGRRRRAPPGSGSSARGEPGRR